MNSQYEVVTDIAEIARLNKSLGERLSETFSVQRVREITYPSGHHTGKVFFENVPGTHVRAWAPAKHDDKLVNYLITGDPSTTKWMQIDVQMNFPAGTYNRRMAGVFVTDSHGDVLVAHRGKLTKGKAGLPKTKVLREFSATTVDADDNGKTSQVILICALDDPSLPDRLWEFADEARKVAAKISTETETDSDESPETRSRRSAGNNRRRVRDAMSTLRDYFDEFSGESVAKGYAGGKRTVEHGDVVKALEKILSAQKQGASQKSQAIDLAIVGQEVELYEVKTSARTTDVYTGVGQLMIHGGCIHELLGLQVHAHLVLPAPPRPSHEKHIVAGGIGIITFERDSSGYRFYREDIEIT